MSLAKLRGKILLSLVLGVAVVLVLGISADAPKLALTLASFHWALLPAILALTLVNYGLRFLKWQLFLRTLGIRGLPARRSGLIWVSGMSMTVTPGKVGEWLKSFLLKEATGTPISASAPIILAERLSDGMAMVLLASGGLILYGYGWQTLAIAVAAGLAIVAVSQYRPLARWTIDTACRVPFLAKRVHQVEAFYEGAKAVFHWRCVGLAILIGAVSWSAEGTAFYLVLLALGVAPAPTLLFQAIFVLSASTIVGALSMLPGGLAVAEGSIAGLLLLLRATDSPAVAAAATIVIRFATLWFGVSLGIIALWTYSRLGYGAPAAAALDAPAEEAEKPSRV